jgi:hypothetical protein
MAGLLRHGARAAQKAYNENRLDHRCGWVQEMVELKREMLEARGGDAAAIEVERRVLIERISFKTVNQRMREAAAMKVALDTGALPALGKDHFTCAESLRRDILALRSLDTQRRAEKTVDWIETEATAEDTGEAA